MLSALILAGGSGTRFWPASRRGRPKQFLALDGERSLLQETVDQRGFAMVDMRDDRDVAKCHVFGIPADSCSCRLPAAI